MAVRPVTHVLGLCAGVGGLELGIMLGEHLRGRDVRGVCYVEREAAGAASLVASMDAGWLHPAPVWSDLATFDGRPWRGRVHCVASGDPCQGNSVAGKGLGSADPRFLIPHVLRIVDEVRPDRLVRENVTGNAAGQLDALVEPLERMGYVVAAGIFSSAATGNRHGRERLIVVADADGTRLAGQFARQAGDCRAPSGRGGVHLDLPPAVVPGPRDPSWRDLLDRWPQLAPAISQEEAQSLLRGGLDAVASRIERLRACGNGVDPVVGAYAWLRLGAALDEWRERGRPAGQPVLMQFAA